MRKQWLNAGLLVGLLSSGGLVRADVSAGDQEFLERALGVNQLELQLGKVAAERGASPDVRATGRTMVQRHTELRQQLVDLSGGSPDVRLTPDELSTFERVAAQSGSAFDATFKQTVDAGHVKELTMYREEVGRATNPKLRELAERRVTKLKETVAKADAPKVKDDKKHDW